MSDVRIRTRNQCVTEPRCQRNMYYASLHWFCRLRVMAVSRQGRKLWLLNWILSFWEIFSTENNNFNGAKMKFISDKWHWVPRLTLLENLLTAQLSSKLLWARKSVPKKILSVKQRCFNTEECPFPFEQRLTTLTSSDSKWFFPSLFYSSILIWRPPVFLTLEAMTFVSEDQ